MRFIGDWTEADAEFVSRLCTSSLDGRREVVRFIGDWTEADAEFVSWLCSSVLDSRLEVELSALL